MYTIGESRMFNKIAKSVVFSVSEIRKHFQTGAAMFSWLKRRIIDNNIVKIKRDLYSIVNPIIGAPFADKFMIGSAITKSSYIAYHSAFEFHGLAKQPGKTMYVAGEERFSPFDFDGIKYTYTRSPFSEGVVSIDKGSDLKVTDLERTLIDCLNNLKLSGGAEEMMNGLETVSSINEDLLLKYLEKYKTNLLYRKAGFVFSHYRDRLELSENFFSRCKESVDNNVYYFQKNEPAPAKLDKDWNLIVPEIEEMMKKYKDSEPSKDSLEKK
jgi:predicted transcriptional regulator of viral defense system